jgi:hypothetical protein
MARPRSVRLSVSPLDDRLTPATFAAVRVRDTLVLSQIHPAAGAIRIYDDPAVGVVSLLDEDNHLVLDQFEIASQNLVVRLAPTAATQVTYDLHSPRAGNVSLGVRNAVARTLVLDGGAQIGGNLTVTAGKGGLTVREEVGLHVTGQSTFRGGAGYDILNLGGAGTTLGSLTTLGFNSVGTSPGDAIGPVVFRDPGGKFGDVLYLSDTTVTGGLTYVGGTRSDSVYFDGLGMQLNGDVSISFGPQIAGDFSEVLQQGGSIDGRVRVTGSRAGEDRVTLWWTVTGDVVVNLGGGTNTLNAFGDFHGAALQYTGGSGVDTIVYDLIGAAGPLTARLGGGADTVRFDTLTFFPSSAFIDFGAGTDTYDGPRFPVYQFLHLP